MPACLPFGKHALWKGPGKYSWISSHRPRSPRSFLHRFLAFPRYMHYRRRGKILSHFSFPSLSLSSVAAAFVRFCDLAVRRRMINDISLSTAGCCCCRWMVARCRRRRQRRLRRAMQLPPPPFRHGENRNHDSSSRSRSGCAIITNKILSSSYLKSAFKIPFHKHCCTCQHVKTLPMENSQFYNIKASIFIINCGTFLGNLQSN